MTDSEIDISYKPHQLTEKLSYYGLNPALLCKKLAVDDTRLDFIFSELPELQQDNLKQLMSALKEWRSLSTFDELTDMINHLVHEWLFALENGVSIAIIQRFLHTFYLKSLFRAGTKSINAFFLSLLTETNHAYQSAQLNWIANFEPSTKLPRSSKLPDIIDLIAKEPSHQGNLALMSIMFHPFKHSIIFSNQENIILNQSIKNTLANNIPTNAKLFYSANLQFDILLFDVESGLKLNLLAAKLFRAFEEMMQGEHQSVLVVPFIGAALNSNIEELGSLQGNAKLALERAVQTQQYLIIYSEDLRKEITVKIHLENEVLNAFSTDSLELHMQPIVDSKTRICKGAELLLRCPRLAQFHIYPSHTIDILNKIGKGKLFTRWLINSACRIASELNEVHDLYITFNLRAEDLYDIELPHLLEQAMNLWKLDSKKIVLEITEEGILELNEISNSVISSLEKMGFSLALDDFGTGFSSLSRLKNMPISLIKIDQSFVKNITRSEEDFKIVESIASLANSLGKEVLAEGIEDEESFALVKKINIHKCQGYLFAKPMSYDDFVAWLQA